MSEPADFSFSKRSYFLLLSILIVACVVRVVPALNYGQDWYGEGSFTLVNFDEAGSCRAALDGFDYSPWVGWQTLALAEASGLSVPDGIRGDARAVKAFCQSESHIVIARLYSAVAGVLTVAALWILAVLLFPAKPLAAPVASALLALSGWHISESMVGTVDAASTFFIYAFTCAVVWSVRHDGFRWLLALLLLAPAVWTKYWVFAFASLAVLIPIPGYVTLFKGIDRSRALLLLLSYVGLFGIVSTPELSGLLIWFLPILFYAVVPWSRLGSAAKGFMLLAPWLAPALMQVEIFAAFTSAGAEGRFGTDYGAIGWHKWLRNPVNIPVVLVMGLGLPGFVMAVSGLAHLWKSAPLDRAWLALLPLLAFVLYMAFLAPVTYYRHYLPLLPLACLLAAVRVSHWRPPLRAVSVALLLSWQAVLAVDLVTDYHFDPRRDLPKWYAENEPQRVWASYYVNPPPDTGVGHRLFKPAFVRSGSNNLRQSDTLILSENWYDTAFANELNGPLVHDPARLIKTTPESVTFYRRAFAGELPFLVKRARLRAPSYMPELLVHRALYGSFTQFVGDIVILEVEL
ncbi:hypothetical protein R0137_03470 [Congregibacter brevis]|uniref:Glycosyltransferase RgtA/B/C/D-like domain-containing protein n=1 Tax=Congregibacter brevis TaxID=3081201 RepID=A0ABZ0IGI8_9GAMM|nr:hypothetical protein R0137_03470 [Congregibacter sp. IMCC45268]